MKSKLILRLITIICFVSMLFGIVGVESFPSQSVSDKVDYMQDKQSFQDADTKENFIYEIVKDTDPRFNTTIKNHIGALNAKKTVTLVASQKSEQGQLRPSNPNATVTLTPREFKNIYDSLNRTSQQDILAGGETGDQYRAWFGNDSYEELHTVTFIYSTHSRSVLIFNHTLGDDRTNTLQPLRRPSTDDYLYTSIAEDTSKLNSTIATETPTQTQTDNSTTMATETQESPLNPESMLGPITTHYTFLVLVTVAGLSIGGAAWHYWVRDQS